MTENLLRNETSPYLLQHQDNPVHWRAWGPEAFAEARAAGKPVLLSVGYAACHWCHVMAHESFENEAMAAVQNELFVNIKVDREERPDVDSIYQHALALLGQQGGWPLTMFLTPEGEPYWGGTYFPPESRWGRPGFVDVLRAMASAYANDPEKVRNNVAAIKEALGKAAEPKAGPGSLSTALLDQIAERLAREVDPVHGGIGNAPKFPNPSIFQLLWRGWVRSRNPAFRTAVVNTLVHMCQGGIYDHLGGGFARYSTDERWLAPHFEKMLYDNAQLVELLTLAWQDAREPLFEERVRETVGWLFREMIAETAPDGTAAFAATLDADSEGEEGTFYVWSEAEIDGLLGEDAALFKRVYDVSAGGNWEHKNILNRLNSLELLDDAAEAKLAECRARLFTAREPRVRPGWDDKVLADWNGLMIAGLAKAGPAFGEPAWVAAAERAFAFVATHMTAEEGRLRHSWRGGQLKHPATLEDYANMIRAGLLLYEVTGRQDYLDRAVRWVETVDRHYADREHGGYFMAADDTEMLIQRPRSAADNATPSGNGVMAEALARLFYLTGEDRYRIAAERTVAAFSGEIERNFFPLATLLNASELLDNAVQVVVAGERDAPDTRALLGAAYRVSLPNGIILVAEGGKSLPEAHPARGKGPVEGRAAAYVCRGPVCSLPVTEPEALRAQLQGGAAS